MVQLTPPDPSTFVWALHHLYTGILLPRHKKLLKAALDKGDGDTFWGLYQNANFLDCATLMDECMEVLRIWVAKADSWDNLGYYQSQLTTYAAACDPRHAVFRHPAFQPSIVWPAALVKLLGSLHSVPLRLFLVLSWLDNEEREGLQRKDLQVASKELASAIDKCASEAVKAGSKLLKPALDAFPSVFHHVITAKLMMPCMEQLEKAEQAEQEAKVSLAKVKASLANVQANLANVQANLVNVQANLAKVQGNLEKVKWDAELLRCCKCGSKVPRSLMNNKDAAPCISMGHFGTYEMDRVGHGEDGRAARRSGRIRRDVC
jgi:hypothetical protein